MGNFIIPQNPAFSDVMRMIETTDSVHADVVNPMFRTLLLDAVFLNNKCKRLEEELAKAQTDNTYGGTALSEQATVAEADAQYPVLAKTSSTASPQPLFSLSIPQEDIRKGYYSLTLRAKVSSVSNSTGLINIKVKSNGTLLEERTITASKFSEANRYKMVGFNVEVPGPLTIEATLLANSANIKVSIDYVMLQPAHTAITSL